MWKVNIHNQLVKVQLDTITLKGKLVKSTDAKFPNFHFHV